MLKKKYTYNLIIIILYTIACLLIYEDNKQLDNKNKISNVNNNLVSSIMNISNNKTDVIATIEIPKINIKEDIYKISNSQEDVDKHVVILENSTFPVEKESILFVAAHSGSGNNAYFNDIDKLSTGDRVNFFYKNKLYTYIVDKKWEEDKNGYIGVSKTNKHELILTTCSNNNQYKQLIIKCIKKE